MTPTIAAESLILGSLLLLLALSEVARSLRLRRVNAQEARAKASLRYYNDLVDKETE